MPNKEIQARASFEIIRYANCWEDPQLLLDGLNIGENAHCLSIASAGDNSFALLTKNPALVVAVDLSAVQLACVELRKVAFAQLPSYEALLGFLGVASAENRVATYTELAPHLSPSVKAFWDKNQLLIANGIIHGGKFERYFQLFHQAVLPWVHSKKTIQALLEEKTLDQQTAFYHKHWNTWRWQLFFRLFFNRFVMGRFGRDTQFFKYVEELVISQHLHKRVAYALTHLSTNQNPYLTYILTGGFQQALPFYLRKEHYETIRHNVDKLQLHQGTVSSAIEHFGVKFDAFNLSDIFEYMEPALFKQVGEELLAGANPKARLAYWNMLVPRQLPQVLPDAVQPLEDLSQQLFLQDQAFFYKSFHVDEVL